MRSHIPTASALLAGVLIATTSAGAEPLSPKTFGSVRPETLRFEGFPAFPPGAKLVVVVGDPSKPGPYVVRVTVSNGVKMMPHAHPEDRIYTVISGIFYIGLGEVFDADKLVAYGPGSVVVLPANTAHFHWARSGDYTTQVNGYGPLGLRYVDPKDDPRNAKTPGQQEAVSERVGHNLSHVAPAAFAQAILDVGRG